MGFDGRQTSPHRWGGAVLYRGVSTIGGWRTVDAVFVLAELEDVGRPQVGGHALDEPNSRSITSPPPYVAFDGLPDALCVAAVEAHRVSRTLDNASSRRQEIGSLGRLWVLVGAGGCTSVSLSILTTVKYASSRSFSSAASPPCASSSSVGWATLASQRCFGPCQDRGSVFVGPQLFETDLLL